MNIKYPWMGPGSGPTPCVLWVCTGCGVAFWAPELADRRYSCNESKCPKRGVWKGIRRATKEETDEAKKHVKVYK